MYTQVSPTYLLRCVTLVLMISSMVIGNPIIWNISYRTYKLSYMPSRYIKGIISNVIRHGCQMLSAMVVRVIHTIYNVFTDGFGILGEESDFHLVHALFIWSPNKFQPLSFL